MAYIVRDCVRCGIKKAQQIIIGSCQIWQYDYEIAVSCPDCRQMSIWRLEGSVERALNNSGGNVEKADTARLAPSPVRIATTAITISEHVPERIAALFREANECRQMTWYEAAGAMYRKTLDVATKHIYFHDPQLEGKTPAQALRVRIKSLGEMKILEEDIVELADVAALDGNDATHDVDPYTADEAEALEDLTQDLLDRLFVRPARLAAVKAKQIASGQRKAN